MQKTTKKIFGKHARFWCILFGVVFGGFVIAQVVPPLINCANNGNFFLKIWEKGEINPYTNEELDTRNIQQIDYLADAELKITNHTGAVEDVGNFATECSACVGDDFESVAPFCDWITTSC